MTLSVLSLWPSGTAIEVQAAEWVSILSATQDEHKFYTGHTDYAKAGCPPNKIYKINVSFVGSGEDREGAQ